MPSFQDSAVIFFLALLLFGPKKLPELARQLGKLMGEFRRASSEFRLQMEDELRVSEQEERQKQIAAIEAAAPKPAPALTDNATVPDTLQSENPNANLLPSPQAQESPLGAPSSASGTRALDPTLSEHSIAPPSLADVAHATGSSPDTVLDRHPHEHLSAPAPIPIATAGDLSMMPPASGLPIPRNGNGPHTPDSPAASSNLAPAFNAIPHATASDEPPPPDRYFRPAGTAPDPQEALAPAEPAAAQHG